MKYAVVFSSKTGNTALLAEEIRKVLPRQDCVYWGEPQKECPDAELIFAGFWTDKGTCDPAMATYLENLQAKQVFLFGTAGFGESADYFAQILSRVREHMNSTNSLAGSYMCQGKMPASVRSRYEAMLPAEPAKMQKLIDNFDHALSHPDQDDLKNLRQAVETKKEEKQK